MVNPSSAIVYGASSRRSNMGARFLERIASTVETTSRGPRHPSDTTPIEADLVVISLPPPAALEVCHWLEGADVGVVVVATALPAGNESRDAVARIGTPETIVLGPASNGYVVAESGLRATSNPIEVTIDTDGCSVVGQSGGFVLNIIGGSLNRRSLGVSLAVCTGQEWRDSWSRVLSGLLGTTRTSAWLAVTERHISATSLRVLAEERDVPAGLLHLGRTSVGSQVAASHSAALSVPSRLVTAACAEAGVLLLDKVESAVDYLEASFSARRSAITHSQGVALLGSSGGTLAYAADRLSDAGIALTELTEAEREAIAPAIDLDGSLSNPCDVGARLGLDHPGFAVLLATLAEASTRSSAALCISVEQYLGVISGLLEQRTREDSIHHVIPAFEGSMTGALPCSRTELLTQGIVAWSSMDAFIASASSSPAISSTSAGRRSSSTRGITPPRDGLARWLALAPKRAGQMDEADSSPLVAAIGLIRPNEWFVALEECHEIGSTAIESRFPDAERLMIKAVDPNLPHRAAVGLLRSSARDDVPSVLEELRKNALLHDRSVRGFLLQEFLDCEGPELLLAARVDPVLGPYLMIGRGGNEVERSPDIEIVFDPERLRSLPEFLARFGATRAVINAGVERLQEIAGVLLEVTEAWQRGIEINPVAYHHRLGGWVALDALIESRVDWQSAGDVVR